MTSQLEELKLKIYYYIQKNNIFLILKNTVYLTLVISFYVITREKTKSSDICFSKYLEIPLFRCNY